MASSWSYPLVGLVTIVTLLSSQLALADLQPLDLGPLNGRIQSDDLLNPGPKLQAIQGFDGHDAPPFTHKHEKRVGSGGPYWMSEIKRQGKVAYSNNASYVIWRNVKDYGAVGDGITDDSEAINNATADGNRCGLGCDSQTTTPAIVYFPPGTYSLSKPLIMYYYTQYIGDANDLPVLQATSDFNAIGVIDSDKYLPYGFSWYTNQNNFYRQVRNFVIDITAVPPTRAVHGIHWQVAQATSLQNIVFLMVQGVPGDKNQQQGIFMDNGSGGYMEDLIFYGGGVGFFCGNQQFTIRNLTFNWCETAIFQNWNWVFLYKDIVINNCPVGIDFSQGGEVPATGSTVLQDVVFNNVEQGIITSFDADSNPTSAGTLVLDNVDFINTDPAISFPNETVILPGNQLVHSWVQGRAYTAFESEEFTHNLTCYLAAANSSRIQQPVGAPPKSASLVNQDTGVVWSRSKPQYEGIPVESFVSSYDFGCVGDGITDDTQCVQNFLNSIASDQIAYFDHGAYLISDTIQVPNDVKIVGEIWPLIMVDGTSSVFSDPTSPKPALRVGNPGGTGTVEMQDIVIETRGPAPGAILMQWNLAGTSPTATGIWDVHFRVGGTNGTLLQSDHCTKNPLSPHGADPSCFGAFMLMHITNTGSLVMVNNWGWVADHELDLADHNQIDIYNGRGILVESQGPVWMYGTSFEHSMLYNYQFANAKDLYFGVIQSETAYMQDNPDALSAFPPLSEYSDPTFAECYESTCYKTFGLRIYNSTWLFMYGAGLYSFFNNYDQGCLLTESCQELMVSLEQSEGIYLYALNTKAAYNMIEVDQVALVPEAANKNGFCQTVAIFEYP